ncbi:MAG: trypsin-like peptidase domain-containing protein [Gemmatimonadaceae bacterium]
MSLEVRVLSGTRAGEREQFDKPVVSIGRHAMSDLRFDPQAELDVSTRHAELRKVDGTWFVRDEGSTNGTFVNEERISEERRLNEGDIVSLGRNGPKLEVHGVGGVGYAPPTSVQPLTPSSAAEAVRPSARLDTNVRVAVAVKEQTKGLKRAMFAGGGVLLAAIVVAFALYQRSASAREASLMTVIAHSESTLADLQSKLASSRPGDSAYVAALKAELEARKKDIADIRQRVASGTANASSVTELSAKLDRTAVMQQSFSQMDVTKIVSMNDAAVGMVVSDFDGKILAGTAFGITKGGLLVTNRHVVKNDAGPAQRIVVIFANTRKWIPVKIVRVSDDDDLALLQIEGPGSYPVVAGVSRAGALARVGAAVASIGYPGATDTPMEGKGMDIIARTTSTPGTVSKRLDDVLQIDSYAGHGSSGSPVFDSQGNVVGVIWGGDAESRGRIVYAVPAQRIAAFIGGDGSGVIR